MDIIPKAYQELIEEFVTLFPDGSDAEKDSIYKKIRSRILRERFDSLTFIQYLSQKIKDNIDENDYPTCQLIEFYGLILFNCIKNGKLTKYAPLKVGYTYYPNREPESPTELRDDETNINMYAVFKDISTFLRSSDIGTRLMAWEIITPLILENEGTNPEFLPFFKENFIEKLEEIDEKSEESFSCFLAKKVYSWKISRNQSNNNWIKNLKKEFKKN